MVKNPKFEIAFVKLLSNKVYMFDYDDIDVISKLRSKQSVGNAPVEAESMIYFEKAKLKRRKRPIQGLFIDGGFIPANSVTVERLFISAR